MSNYVIQLTPGTIWTCNDFADKRMAGSVSMYVARGESSINKIRQDIVTGAMAEFALWHYLSDKGLAPSKPDLTIYPQGQKSFAADLTVGDKHVHVKAQTIDAAKRYGASWLFQKTDKVISLPSENAYMAFCLVRGNEVTIKAIVSTLELAEFNLWKKPKVPKYQTTKVALYLQDILDSKINTWRL